MTTSHLPTRFWPLGVAIYSLWLPTMAAGWQMDRPLSQADASFLGEAADDASGGWYTGLSSAGDVNADGYGDFLVGVILSDASFSDAGQVYLFLGRPTPWSMDTSLSAADASYLGEASTDHAGASVSGAGDVNGDGYDDFIVGASFNDHGGNTAGQVYFLFGKASGWSMDVDLGSSDASYIGEDEYDNAGWCVSNAGDVNGDGFADVVIGAESRSEADTGAGQAYLIFGRSTGWSMDLSLGNADASFLGEAAHDKLGWVVADAGDVNGDGFDDTLLSAWGSDDAGTNAGQAYLFFGKGSGWSQDVDAGSADASFVGEAPYDYLGYSLAGAGDVNGDGYDDLLIGAFPSAEGGTAAGQVYLVFGAHSGWALGEDIGNADASFLGEDDYDNAGWIVSGAGDVNGDELDDLLIGAHNNNEGTWAAGQTYIVFGSVADWAMDVDLGGVDASFLGEADFDYSGMALSGAGDANGDGLDDILIGAPYNDEGDVDAGQTYLVLGVPTCTDGDGDGYGDPGDPSCPEGSEEDCDDADADVYPGADEYCNAVDDDCDGTIDEDDALNVLTWYEDNDGDGYGNVLVSDLDCDQPVGYVADATDCDDTDPAVNPDETETTCDGVDNDCDPATEDEPDNDGDGYSECDDCDDGDADVNPGITYDECTGVDNDCNGAVDDGDLDGDGWTVCDDCDDDDVDLTWDDLDGDGWSTCAGDCDDGDAQLNLADLDGDGWDTCAGECDDTDADRYPGAQELCDALDNDCDGVIPEDEVDDDGDGYMVCGGDCQDGDAAFYPGALELCDALDNDCDGTIPADEVDDDGDGYLACEECDDDDALLNLDDFDEDGYSTCDGDADDADPTVFPGADELCDGLDNDCDGVLPADEADADGDGFMLCEGDLDDNDPTVYPTAPELHDGLDNDCDGLVDEGMLPANALIITEIMRDPSLVDDTSGEWFEVYNNTAQEMNLYGMEVEDLGTNSFVVASDVWVLPYEHAMLGRDDDPDLNGGVDLDYEYGTLFSLANTDDEIIITFDGEELDRVEFWDPDWPDVSGEAMSLDPSAYDTALNDDPASWCSAQDAYGDGDLGTPGEENPVCCPDVDGDGYLDALCGGDDCDDADAAVHPGVAEVACDYIDNDCDGNLHPDEMDQDGDGWDACQGDVEGDPDVNPGELEVACDYIDNNCDGVFHPHEVDDDGDGFDECGADQAVGTADDDCDDTDADVFPGQAETPCDGLDNDCDAGTEDEPDADGDGYSVCLDCDDGDSGIHPAANEVTCDGIDNDCDGLTEDEPDTDGDGYSLCVDCDDADSAVNPGASDQACDYIDNDCDGNLHADEVDNDGDGWSECLGDPDDTNPAVFPGAAEIACDYLDNDGDGQLHPEEMDDDGDGVDECQGDCDDAEVSTYPGADEYCDGIDNDCDGVTDEDDAVDVLDWYQDLDGDGFGNPAVVDIGCTPPATFVGNDEDCDDLDFYVHPGAEEVCNGVDDDCDPATDEHADEDGDSFSLCEGDCDDLDSDVNPGAVEECDGIDNDCDETTNEEVDGDGDTYAICDGDCDDDQDTVYPGASELCDGLDNDCDDVIPADEEDLDGDGYLPCGLDCDDTNASVYEGAVELCDGIDNDCDDLVDEDVDEDLDADGYNACQGDCDNENADVYPGATELCDGADNDCDGALPQEEEDLDGDGWLVCSGDCDDQDAMANPADEDGDGWSTCDDPPDCEDDNDLVSPGRDEDCEDGFDNNCDGLADSADPECIGDDDDAGDDDTTDDDDVSADDDTGEEAGCECKSNTAQPFAMTQMGLLTLLGSVALRRRRT